MIDVSDVLCDPMMGDEFSVLRRTEFVNQYGESKVSVECIDCLFGIIAPEGTNDLYRRPEAQLQTKSITVTTRFALRGPSKSPDTGKSYQPDIVRFRGSHFVVLHLEDASNFARGFTRAVCTEIEMTGPATTAVPLSKISPRITEGEA
jgi:hypothetical protein